MKLDVSGLKEGELVEGGVTLVQGSSSIRGEHPGRVVFEAVGHLRHATIDHSAIKQHERPGARRILCLPTRSIIAECQWSRQLHNGGVPGMRAYLVHGEGRGATDNACSSASEEDDAAGDIVRALPLCQSIGIHPMN